MKGMMDMSLGEIILKQRKKLGLSQEQLGFEIDVSRQTISNWECEETAPNPKQLVALAKLFDMSVDALLDNVTEEKEILMNKVSNTERLAGMIIKILRTTEDGVIDSAAQKALNKFLHNIDEAVVNIAAAVGLV